VTQRREYEQAGERAGRRPVGAPCRWCGRPLPPAASRGRPRVYCRQSCRQRHYEASHRAAELGLGEDELVLARSELDALRDRIYVLECAIADVERDLAAGLEPTELQEALAWLLDAAKPLVDA
jgi:hypothetical protein